MPVFHIAQFRKVASDAGDNSTTQIAARTGLNRAQIARLLNGERQPTLASAVRLADAYDIGIDELVLREQAA